MRTLIRYKRNMIAPLNLFLLLTVSRMLIVFTISSAVLNSRYSADILISIACAFLIVLIVSLPVMKLIEDGKNIQNNRIISAAYGLYFIYAGAVNVSKFAMFSASELNQNTKLFFLAGSMIIACIYASSLGIEAVSRFGSFVFVLLIIGFVGIICFSAKDFSVLNLYPLVQNGRKEIFMNTLLSVASTNEMLLLFVLAPKINGKIKKPFYFSMLLAFILSMVMVLIIVSVLGDTASYYSYPAFEVSQLAKLGTNERLEAVFIAVWIFAIFLKTTLYLYCSTVCFKIKKGNKSSLKNIVCGIVMFLASWPIISGNAYEGTGNKLIIIPFLVFAVVIPLLYLIFGKRRSKGIEAYEDI